MSHLLAKHPNLRAKLKKGLSVLIAPHHGLKSSFSTDLFENMEDAKVRCLNVISEKVSNPDESRNVDTRYSSKDYCKGLNDLPTTNGIEKCCQRKTSSGHICIDYAGGDQPKFKIISDTQELIKWFL